MNIGDTYTQPDIHKLPPKDSDTAGLIRWKARPITIDMLCFLNYKYHTANLKVLQVWDVY